MTTAPPPRPSQVTMAGWMVVAGSILVVLVTLQAFGALQSVDVRDNISRAIAQGKLGTSVDSVVSVLRGVMYALGIAAAVAAVLGVYALRRSREARIALSVLAGPILIGATVTQNPLGTMFASVVAGSTAMLWSLPARDWFAGRTPEARRDRTHPGAPVWRNANVSTPDHGQPPWAEAPPPAPGTQHTASITERPPARPLAQQAEIPFPVRTACTLTVWFSGLAAVTLAAVAVVLVTDPQSITRHFDQKGMARFGLAVADVRELLLLFTLMGVAWAVGACVLAWFARRRHEWAWILLLISTAFAGLMCIGTLPFAVAHLVGAAATFTLLVGEPARAWFGRRPPRSAPRP